MIRAAVAALLALAALEARAQVFPVPGPGHAPWVASAPSGGSWASTFGACVPGSTCFCDRVKGTGTLGTSDPIYNSAVFWCADFDHDAFYETTPVHVNDAFGNKNWISTTGALYGSGDRGGGSRWAKLYQGTWSGMTWEDGRPTTTCGGVITSVGGSGIGSGPMEWDAADRWCANAYGPRIDIIKTAADYSAENGSTAPTIPGSGGANVLGNYLLGMRVGVTDEAGFMSDQPGVGAHAQLGVTVALGYESNVASTGILSLPWKHEEFGGVNGGVNDGLFLFRQDGTNGAPLNTFPIHGFMFSPGFSCPTAIASAVQTLGTMRCDPADNVIWFAEQGTGAGQYEWPTDFNLSQLHCVSAHWDFRTISSVDVRFWFDGELVLDISNINLTGSIYDGLGGTNGIDEFELNAYSNKAGLDGISAPTRRFVDNYVMRDGTPVLCDDIGFPSSYNQAGL